MTHLAPHPWDTIGTPPRPGLVYDPPADLEAALSMAELLRGADADYEEAESLRSEALDCERRGHDQREEAHTLRSKVNFDALCDAIEKEPGKFQHDDDVRAWVHGR